MENKDKPTYPVQIDGDVDVHNYGLTKLEYFTAMAMQGICANSEIMRNFSKEMNYTENRIAQMSKQIAKETLNQLESNGK